RSLFDTVVGATGRAFLAEHPPTALMVDVDETILDLPWELLRDGDDALAERVPFGRIVSTRIRPKVERDPVEEDRELRILAVLTPTGDVAYMDAEVDALRSLASARRDYVLDVLQGPAATRAALDAAVRDGQVDLLHFSGHGAFDPRRPGDSGLRLADGPLAT